MRAPVFIGPLAALLCFAGCGQDGPYAPLHSGGGTPGGNPGPGMMPSGGTTPAGHRLFPQVSAHRGQVLASMRLISVVTQGDPLADQLFSFGQGLLPGPWWQSVGAEYGVIQAGSHLKLTGPPIAAGTAVNTNFLQAYINQAINGQVGYEPNGRTLYQVYLPRGVDLSAAAGGPNDQCQILGGYHDVFGTQGDGLSVIQRCPIARATELDALTLIASHEAIEAATDTGQGWSLGLPGAGKPWNDNVWVAGGHVEIGDLCEGTRVRSNGFLYTRVFSNHDAALEGDPCVPSLAPYFGVTADKDWYQAAPGVPVTVALSGWSSAQVQDFYLRFSVEASSQPPPTPALQLQSATSTMVGGQTFSTLNNGRNATLSVTLPPGTPSGSYLIFGASALIDDPAAMAPLDTDLYHVWLFGVYVP